MAEVSNAEKVTGESLIALSATRSDMNSQIYLVDTEGKRLRCLTCARNLPYCQDILWSPDRQQILFSSRLSLDHTNKYYILNTDGSNLRRLPVIPSPSRVLRWLPDNRILFVAHKQFWISALEGAETKSVGSRDECWDLQFSADGLTALFVRPTEGLFIATGDLSTSYKLFAATDHDFDPHYIRLSPDGRRVAYICGDEELWVVNIEDASRAKITTLDYFALHFQWSPSGQQLAFSKARYNRPGNTEEAIYIRDLGPSLPEYLIHIKSEGSVGSWRWSLDGTGILYVFHKNGIMQLHSISIEERRIRQLVGAKSAFEWIYNFA